MEFRTERDPLGDVNVPAAEKTVCTSFASAPRDFQASVRLIEARRFDLKPWTDILPLEQGQRGFLKMAHAPGATLKMMLTA